MDKDRLQILTTFLITLALLGFAYRLVLKAFEVAAVSERVSPETLVAGVMTLATGITMAAVARWLQQGAQATAEKQAEKIQEAVASVTSVSNGSGSPPTPSA